MLLIFRRRVNHENAFSFIIKPVLETFITYRFNINDANVKQTR